MKTILCSIAMFAGCFSLLGQGAPVLQYDPASVKFDPWLPDRVHLVEETARAIGLTKLTMEERAALGGLIDNIIAGIVRKTIESVNADLKRRAVPAQAAAPPAPRVVKAGTTIEQGLSIRSRLESGSHLELDDGSVWEVSVGDQISVSTWNEGDDVLLINGDTIFNLDEREEAHVRRRE